MNRALLGIVLAIAIPMTVLGQLAQPRAPQPAASNEPLPEGASLRLGTFRLRHSTEIRNAALSPDGKRLATASTRSVIVWDLERGTPLRHFALNRDLGFVSPGLVFSPNGRRLGFVRSTTFACVWDLDTGKEIWRAEESHRPHSYCQFTPDGNQFVVSERDHTRFVNLATGKTVQTTPANNAAFVAPDCKTFVQTDEGDRLRRPDDGQGRVETRCRRCSERGRGGHRSHA
jgi:WD40 repeat protein